MAASQKLGELMYAQQQPGGQPGGAQPGAEGPQAGANQGRASADDDVVDADFKEVKRD
jgi:molecular chaperone DnaK